MHKNIITINENPNPERPDLRRERPETVEEFLARGGKIKRLSSPEDIWVQWVKRELFEETDAF